MQTLHACSILCLKRSQLLKANWCWKRAPRSRDVWGKGWVRMKAWVLKGDTMLLKGTQVEFNCPNECLIFLEWPWWEHSKKCGEEKFYRASLKKKFFLRFLMGLFSPTRAFSGGFWQISLKRFVYVKNWRKQTAFFSILGLDGSSRGLNYFQKLSYKSSY